MKKIMDVSELFRPVFSSDEEPEESINFFDLDLQILEKFGLYTQKTNIINVSYGSDALGLINECNIFFESFTSKDFFLEATVFQYNENCDILDQEVFRAHNIYELMYIFDIAVYCRLNYAAMKLTEIHVCPKQNPVEYSLYFDEYTYVPIRDRNDLAIESPSCSLPDPLCEYCDQFKPGKFPHMCHLECGHSYHDICLRYLIENQRSLCCICKQPFIVKVQFTSKVYQHGLSAK